MKNTKRYTMAALCAALMMVMCAFMIILPSDSDAVGTGTQADPVDLGTKVCWTYSPIFLMSSGTEADDIRWDFGDGTVLDSTNAGQSGYAALLAAHKGNVWKPVNTSTAKGSYVVKQCAIGGENGELQHWSKMTVQIMGDPIVTFDSDGGSDVASQTVAKVFNNYNYNLQKATKPNDPTRAGYTFDGWYLVSGTTVSENQFSFNTEISESITLRAKWISGGEVVNDDLQKFVEDHSIAIILTVVLAMVGAIAFFTRHPVVIAASVLIAIAAIYVWFAGGKI